MNFLIKILFFILIIGCTVANKENDVEDDYLFDYYLDLINNRSQEAQEYQYLTDARMHEPADKTLREYGEYDFIVVGAGTTGCIVANRLSEITEWKILLLEAGTYPDGYLTGIPSMFSQDGLSDFNWGFKSVPQKYGCLGNVDRRCLLHRGKGIGGTSLINGLVYSRGNPKDYQRWADLLNDTSFTYENILPYFIKSEIFTKRNPYVPIATEYHGYEGPLHTTHTVPPSDFSNAVLLGSQQIGYDIVDYNGPQQVGGSIAQYYLKNGRRDDPGKAYISTIKNRSNIVILDKSFAIKLQINESTKRAEGVIFTRNNKTYIARNRTEIIVSAGAISTPQLLMLSGIGPQNHLQSLGIPVIRNLSVGETLHDHLLTPVIFSSNISNPTQNREDSLREFLRGEGPFTKAFPFDAMGWYKTPSGMEGKNVPDTEIVFSNFSGGSTKTLGWTNETYNVLNPVAANPITIILNICHPKSSGSIKLASSDPYEYPLINSNILSADKDMKLLYESLLVTLKLTETEALQKYNVSVVPGYFPECNHTEPLSEEFWYCYFRRATTLAGHVMGSCVTGSSPENGVVDKELKVFGLKDLRIADAGVVPFAMADHPTATLSMLAEKISDQIKREYGQLTASIIY